MAVWGGVAHRSLIGLLVEGLPKYGYNKEIDEEGDRQGDGGLNQEVHVGFSDVRPAGPVYLSRLHQGRVQVDVVRHDDGADDAHGLQQLWTAAARARGQEQALKKR